MTGEDYIQGYWGWRFDILKFVMSIIVVMIHTHIMPLFFEPLLSVAVPVFYVISSYIFWSRISSEEQIPGAVTKYIKRNLLLYLYWIIVLIVPIMFINRWFADGITVSHQIILIIRDFFFWEVFPGSWFLMALPLGMLIISLLVNVLKANNNTLVVIALLAYSLCWVECFEGTYMFVHLSQNPMKNIIPYFSNSFISSLPYIVIGKLIAESKLERERNPLVLLIVVLSVILFIIERSLYDGSYISIVVLSTGIFVFVLQIKENNRRNMILLRRASVIIYCSHKTIAILINTFLRYFGMDEILGIRLFVATFSLSMILAFFILLCASKTKIRLLRYAY